MDEYDTCDLLELKKIIDSLTEDPRYQQIASKIAKIYEEARRIKNPAERMLFVIRKLNELR